MNGKIRFWLLGVAACLIVAAWSLLSTPGTALAKGKPPGGGGGNGSFDTQGYWVWFSQDPLGAFEPEGPRPAGSAENDTDGGSVNVVAGAVSKPDDPEMFIHGNVTCLDSWVAGPEIDPTALLLDDDFTLSGSNPGSNEDFADCFPSPSRRGMFISADGMTVEIRISGLSTSGKDLSYVLTIDVIGSDVAGGQWDPLGIGPGDIVTLYLGAWELTTQNPKHQGRGCSAKGDFSDDVDLNTGKAGTDLAVSRWTLDEQVAHNACE